MNHLILVGHSTIRALWMKCLEGLSSIVYVVDASDRERIPEALGELVHLLKDAKDEGSPLDQMPVLILCNKSDLANVATPAEIKAELERLCSNHPNLLL